LDIVGEVEEQEALEDFLGRDDALEVLQTHFLPTKEMLVW